MLKVIAEVLTRQLPCRSDRVGTAAVDLCETCRPDQTGTVAADMFYYLAIFSTLKVVTGMELS